MGTAIPMGCRDPNLFSMSTTLSTQHRMKMLRKAARLRRITHLAPSTTWSLSRADAGGSSSRPLRKACSACRNDESCAHKHKKAQTHTVSTSTRSDASVCKNGKKLQGTASRRIGVEGTCSSQKTWCHGATCCRRHQRRAASHALLPMLLTGQTGYAGPSEFSLQSRACVRARVRACVRECVRVCV
eukprot:1413486-Pleurochrysis_carterae.AAC.3